MLRTDSLSGYQLDIHRHCSVPPRISLRSWRAVPQSASAVKGPVLPQRIALQLSSPPPTDYQFNSQPEQCNVRCCYYYYYLTWPKDSCSSHPCSLSQLEAYSLCYALHAGRYLPSPKSTDPKPKSKILASKDHQPPGKQILSWPSSRRD